MQPKPAPKDLVIPEDLKAALAGKETAFDVKAAVERKERELKAFKQRRGSVMKDFKAWAKKDMAKGYEAFTPIGDLVLIRLYLYEPPADQKKPKLYTGIHDDGSGLQKLEAEMFPYAKVLATGSAVRPPHDVLKPNDIVLIQDSVCGVEPNKEWVEWKMITTEKPSIEREWPQPPRYIPSVSNWGKFIFKKDKFMPGDLTSDAYTFLVPPSMVRCLVNVDEIR